MSDALGERLLDADEAAALLRVSRKHLYEMIRSQGLPHLRIGVRAVRFTRRDLNSWVEQNLRGRAA